MSYAERRSAAADAATISPCFDSPVRTGDRCGGDAATAAYDGARCWRGVWYAESPGSVGEVTMRPPGGGSAVDEGGVERAVGLDDAGR